MIKWLRISIFLLKVSLGLKGVEVVIDLFSFGKQVGIDVRIAIGHGWTFFVLLMSLGKLFPMHFSYK